MERLAFVILVAALVKTLDSYIIEISDPCKSNEKELNRLLDDVIANVTSRLDDPLNLPDRNFLWMKLSEGKIWGIKDLFRLNDARVKCRENRTAAVSVRCEIPELKARYKWSDLLNEGVAFVKASNVQIRVELSLKEGEELRPQLDKIQVTWLQNVELSFTGIDYVSWLLGKISTNVANLFKAGFASVLHKTVAQAFEQELSLIRFIIAS